MFVRKINKIKISRYSVLIIVMLILFAIISMRIVYLQIYKGQDYKEKANVESTRLISERAPRGTIVDNTGEILATNIESYVLTYTATNDSEKEFYTTMDKVSKLLKNNNETMKNDMFLKHDSQGNLYYDFKSDSVEEKRALEIRFKRDRGLNEEIEKRLFGENREGDFTEEEISAVNKELLKLTPNETFYKLIKIYELYGMIEPNTKEVRDKYKNISGKSIYEKLLKKYSEDQIITMLTIKDSIKMESFKGYKAVTIASNIKKETAFTVYQMLNDLPGIDVAIEPVRNYPYKNLASSVLGYVSPIGSSESKNYALKGYDASSDLIGVAGIEGAFEGQLKGTKGGTTVKVDSKGRTTEELFKLEPYPGNTVHLTINKEIQYAAEQSLKDIINQVNSMVDFNGATYPSATRGAVVAIEVKTGRVLAMANYPDYDPNLFSVPGKMSSDQSKSYFSPDYETFYKDYVNKTGAKATIDELFPKNEDGVREDVKDLYPRSFFNYATQGLIPPGSSFKPLTALAGLEEGVVTPNEILNDTGVWNIHPETFGEAYAPTNYAKIGHGPIDIKKALEVSSNFYFYEIGYRLYIKGGKSIESLNSIAKYAWKFGLGVAPGSRDKITTGIEIEENFGQVYNFESFKRESIEFCIFTLVEEMEKGDYYGGKYKFVPFDLGKSDDDVEDVVQAKEHIKDLVKEELGKVGTSEKTDEADLRRDIKKNVKIISKKSTKYKNNIKKYEESNNITVDLDDEIDTVTEAIVSYTINEKSNEIKSPAELVNGCIGQGSSRFTPLQLANYIATLANGGTRRKTYLVDKITSPEGKVIQEFKPEIKEEIKISEQTLKTIKEGMYRVNHADGSSFVVQQFGGFPIPTAGKTGTADLLNTDEDYKYIGRNPYATYASFAPVEDPEIATYTVLYDGGRGSYSSYPSKAIYEAYFKDKLLKDNPSYTSETFEKYIKNSPFNKKND